MTKSRKPARLRKTPQPVPESLIVLDPTIDSTKRYISKIELVSELFDLVLCDSNVKTILRLRRVAQHWKCQIDSSSALQKALFMKSIIPSSVIELGFTHPRYLLERYTSLLKVPQSHKYCVSVELNELLCKTSTDQPDTFDRRVSKGDTVLLDSGIIIPYVLSNGTREEKYETAILDDRVVTPQLKLEKQLTDRQLDMLLTQPPVKAAYLTIFNDIGHTRVESPSGLRLRDILDGVDRSGVLRGILSRWHQIQPENKTIKLNFDGALDQGREGYISLDEEDLAELHVVMADREITRVAQRLHEAL